MTKRGCVDRGVKAWAGHCGRTPSHGDEVRLPHDGLSPRADVSRRRSNGRSELDARTWRTIRRPLPVLPRPGLPVEHQPSLRRSDAVNDVPVLVPRAGGAWLTATIGARQAMRWGSLTASSTVRSSVRPRAVRPNCRRPPCRRTYSQSTGCRPSTWLVSLTEQPQRRCRWFLLTRCSSRQPVRWNHGCRRPPSRPAVSAHSYF